MRECVCACALPRKCHPKPIIVSSLVVTTLRDVGQPHHIVFVAAVICLKRECVGVQSSREIKD